MWFASWSSQIQCNQIQCNDPGLRRGTPKSNVTILPGQDRSRIRNPTKKKKKKNQVHAKSN